MSINTLLARYITRHDKAQTVRVPVRRPLPYVGPDGRRYRVVRQDWSSVVLADASDVQTVVPLITFTALYK